MILRTNTAMCAPLQKAYTDKTSVLQSDTSCYFSEHTRTTSSPKRIEELKEKAVPIPLSHGQIGRRVLIDSVLSRPYTGNMVKKPLTGAPQTNISCTLVAIFTCRYKTHFLWSLIGDIRHLHSGWKGAGKFFEKVDCIPLNVLMPLNSQSSHSPSPH